MKTLLLLAAIICSNISIGQTITLNEIDRFTQNKVFQVNVSKNKKFQTFDKVSKGINHYVYFSFKAINKDYYFQTGTACNNQTICFNDSSEIIFLFTDKSTLKLKYTNPFDCQSTLLTGVFNINSEQIKEIETKILSEFRIYYSENYIDYTVKKDKQNLIKETANVFLREINK